MFKNEADFVFRERYPERDEIYARYDRESAAIRCSASALLDIPYGNHPRSRFDLFWGAHKAQLVVFIHGGYWQGHSRDRYSFVAAPLIKLGYSVAVLGYPIAPEYTITEINCCVMEALREIGSVLRRKNYQQDRVILAGHSAGGHLATCASLDWGVCQPSVAAVMPVSGIFDLEPIIQTSLNKALCLDLDKAAKLSPMRRPPPTAPVVAFVGSEETDEFISQSRNYVEHCNVSDHGRAELIPIDRSNHYSILLDFFQPDSKIVGKITDHMDLRR